MDSEKISERSRININTYRLVSYVLVALMIACGATTIADIASRFNPGWQPRYLAFICFLVAIDRLYTYRRFRDWMFLSKEWLIRFGSQWITIVALTKLTVGLSHGLDAFLAEIPLWRQDLFAYFFDNELIFALALVVIVWIVCGNFAGLLEEIGPEQIDAPGEIFGLQQRPLARKRLMAQFFSIGSVLVILTALGRLDLRSTSYPQTHAFFAELPALAAGGASTLLYFMLGLALLSQTQFITLHVRWNTQRIPVNSKLARHWAVYSVLFFGLVALVVSLLPTSYSINPILLLSYAINMVLFAIVSIGQVVLYIYLYLLGLLFSLFGKEPPAQNANEPPLELPTLPPDAAAAMGPGPDWWEIIKSLAFWVIFLGILVYSIRQYLGQHEEVLAKLRKLPGWNFLTQAWRWLRTMFDHARREVIRAVDAVRESARRATARENFWGGGFLNPRKLDPRQRIYFYYLALIRRGGENGLTRSLSQTPYEYAATLETALPDTGEDIDSLTEAFIEARYTRQPVELEKANLVERTWERIRKALRGKR